MAKLLPILLIVLGLGTGIGAGFLTRGEPETDHAEKTANDDHGDTHSTGTDEPADADGLEYARMTNQFVIPVVKGSTVTSLVVLSITLEVKPGETETVFQKEPKLRDMFLSVLFNHANIGGFDAGFTEAGTLSILRAALFEAATATLGNTVTDVLITDILRQEV